MPSNPINYVAEKNNIYSIKYDPKMAAIKTCEITFEIREIKS